MLALRRRRGIVRGDALLFVRRRYRQQDKGSPTAIQRGAFRTATSADRRRREHHSVDAGKAIDERAAKACRSCQKLQSTGNERAQWRDPGQRISQARIDACIERIFGDAPRLAPKVEAA